MTDPAPPRSAPSFWPFRRRPLGDIAQAVLELMEDEAQWRVGFLALHHASAVVVRNTGFFVSVSAGDAGLRLEGRDQRAVDKAYTRLKRRLNDRNRALRADKLRAAMFLPRTHPSPQALPSSAVPSDESLEAVERRVRRLREAIALRT